MNRSLKGYFPTGMSGNATAAGGQINTMIHTKDNINLMRLLFQSIGAGAGAGGTSTIFGYLVQRLQVWACDKAGTPQKEVIDINNTTLLQAYRAGVIRLGPGSEQDKLPAFTDDTIDTAGTYYAWLDIVVNLLPGDYKVEATIAPASGCAVYVPATLDTIFAAAAYDLGFDVDENEVMKAGSKVTTNGFTVTGIREAYIDCASDMATVVSVYEMDGKSLNSWGLKTLESVLQDKFGSATLYATYQTSKMSTAIHIELSTATTTAFVTYSYQKA